MLRLSPVVLTVLAVLLFMVPFGVRTKPPKGLDVQPLPTFKGSVKHGSSFLSTYKHLPLAFERNQGQTDSRVEFLSRDSGYDLYLTRDEAVLHLRTAAAVHTPMPSTEPTQVSSGLLHMKLVGTSSHAFATGFDELPGKSNYFIGNDPSKWHTDVANYAKVKYTDVYPGVDLVYYGNHGELEYDFVVAPGADPHAIQVRLDQPDPQMLRLDSTGALIANTVAGEVRFPKPVIYQNDSSGVRQLIDGRYKLLGANLFAFDLSDYDRNRQLVIDPVMSYSSFLGGTSDDGHDSVSVAFDSSGNLYVASGTLSTNFPVSAGSVQSAFGGGPAICDQGTNFCGDAFVTKINASGTAIIYSTYLGGSDSDYAYGLAVDSAGNAYVAGLTKSANFPVTAGVFQPQFGGSPSPCDDYVCGDAFVAKLNSTGSALVYSSYLGGSGNEHPEGLVIDAQGNAYLAGDTGSPDFPTTPGAFQTELRGTDTCQGRSGDAVLCHNAFLSKINPSGTKLVYSTYLGGSGGDGAGGVAVDSFGRATAVGSTCSADFPVTAGAFQTVAAGGCDIFVSMFNAAGSQLAYSTYFGGTGYEASYSAATDSSGNVYLSGLTYSTDLPVTKGAAQTTYGGNGDALVAKFNPHNSGAASLVYATYLGGSQSEVGAAIGLDAQGNAYTCGDTSSSNFPLTSPLQSTKRGVSDVFLTKLNAQGSALVFSTFLGGSSEQLADNVAVDDVGNIYLAGWTRSGDFPTTSQAFQPSFGGGATDIFVVKINPANAAGVSLTPSSLTFANQAVGTTSPPQTMIVHDVGSAEMVISSILTTGDFAQTSNCNAGVSGGGSCAISITFTPVRSGSRSGFLSLTDNAGGSPQKFLLSGIGK